LEYAPAEDTFFLLDSLPRASGSALEIGCGSCYIIAHINAKFKVGCDIRRPSNLHGDFNFVLCDGKRLPFRNNSFELIFFNPPYLPSNGVQDPAVDGGKGGIEIAIHFLEESVGVLKGNGHIFTVLSSLSDLNMFRKKLKELKLSFYEKEKKLFFEELHVFNIYAHKD